MFLGLIKENFIAYPVINHLYLIINVLGVPENNLGDNGIYIVEGDLA